MADRRTSAERLQPTLRHRSPSLDDPQYHHESLRHASAVLSAGTSRTRRRPSRTGSIDKVSPQSASPPYEDGDRGSIPRSKAGRNILKKVPRRDSLQSDTSAQSQGGYMEDEDEDIGFVPKLGQIREGKESRPTNSRASSTVSSTVEPKTRRRRHTEDPVISRSRAHHKYGSSQRRAESFAKLSNPSLVSLLSEATQQSSASTGSNTTATQRSYDDLSLVAERPSSNIAQGSNIPKAFNNMVPTEVDGAYNNVFQFLNEEPQIEQLASGSEYDVAPSTIASSSSTSSSDSELNDAQSSSAGSSQVRDTPTTSPASTRRSDCNASHHRPRGYRKPGVPLYASSFVHGHEDHDEEAGEVESGEGTEANSDEGEDEEENEDEDEDEGDTASHSDESEHANHLAIEKTPPPRVPSVSSRDSDSHTRRLRQQERELANHVLQSPQPQKDFQFAGAPSPHPFPSMPMYSPRGYSGADPAGFAATAGYPAEWPPFPPPLPLGFPLQSTLESTTAGHALPLTVQPPISVPSHPAQQQPPPFHQHPGQPPHYQPHVPVPDITRTTVAGYELLANKLSEPLRGSKALRRAGNIVPMYRKFEHLNHRVLLHLQDETCELEEELRYLDECIIQMSPRDEAGHAYPASRRGDAEYGSELHYKRTELLGRIFQKLGQYNQALTSFSSLLRDLEPASIEDIQAYRAWMEKRAPIDHAETRFLDRRNDLVAVSRKPSINTTHAGRHQPAAVWLPLVLVLPLMAFAIVPTLLGRLVVIALIGVAELGLVTSTPELMNYMTVQGWTAAAPVYFGLMAVLAGVVR